MKRKTTNNTIVCRYDSVGELSRRLETANTQAAFKNHEQSKGTSEYRAMFAGSETYEAADSLLLYGDKELQKKIEAAGVSKTRAKLTGKGTRREIYSSVAGFAAHVPNYIAGVPTSMLNVRQKRTAVPVIDLYYGLTAAHNEAADDIIEASAKVISAAMQIEAQGIRLNIHTVITSKKDGQNLVFGCKIKTSGQPFDTLKMAYPMAHPSMLRRHFFRAVETTEGVSKRFVNSYGVPVVGSELQDMLKKNNIAADTAKVIDYYQAKQMTIDEIVKRIAG